MADGVDSFQRFHSLLLLGGDRQCQAVDPNILLGDAVRQGRVQDAAGDSYPLLCRLGDAALVQGQTHYGGAVLFHDGQDAVQHLCFAVDGVHCRLTVVDPQARFQGGGVGGIQLQGQGNGALQVLYHPGQHGDFVHTGEAHVHIQDVGSRVLLLDGDIQNVVQVVFQQRLLEPLFAGGIHPLADDPHAVQAAGGDGGADAAGIIIGAGSRHFAY